MRFHNMCFCTEMRKGANFVPQNLLFPRDLNCKRYRAIGKVCSQMTSETRI